MHIEQLYTNCLAEAAYFIESNGEAVVIDPLRDIDVYLEKAKERNAKIKYIFETHFHADFVSGHVALAKATGAKIVFGPEASTVFKALIAEDGQLFTVGDLQIKVLHTPGHTPESSCYLLLDKDGVEKAVFTGDTLFIGDVGRPDLAVKSNLTQADLASMLYDSLRSKIMPLPDDIIVYPAHGAGSACGKNISTETFSTLGNQKASNYALQDISKKDFIKQLTEGIMPAPRYFAENVALNKSEIPDLNQLLAVAALPPDIFKAEMERGAVVIDTRLQDSYAVAHIPNALYIGLKGQFAVWAATLVPTLKTAVLLVTDTGSAEEAVTRLARVGFDNVKGVLKGGMTAWQEAGYEVKTTRRISSEDYSKGIEAGTLLDVRKPGEYEAGYVSDSQSIPLDFMPENLEGLDKEAVYTLYCRSGFRSVIAASVLERNGFSNVKDIVGGVVALEQSGISLTEGTKCTA